MKKCLFITTKNLDYIRNSQEINWLSKKDNKLEIIGSRDKSYIKRMVKVYTKLLTTDFNKYDEIFVGFAPQLIIPVFYNKFKAYKKTGKKLSIDFFISVYDTFVCDRKKFKKGSLLARYSMHVDKKSLVLADEIIVDTKAHGEYFVKEFNADRSKIKVLYLEADKKIYHPMKVEKPEEYKDKLLVLYFGSVLPLQGVEYVLQAIDLLKDEDDIHFIVIGPVKNKKESENATYIPWLSQEELAKTIAYADVCLAGHFNADIDKARRTIPGKAYIYRAMDKPMILGDNPANRELFDDFMDGIEFCKMSDAKSLADSIRKIAK